MKRAGFEVRRRHPTQYGRICPIGPEGPNIGLIASLSTFAKVNEFGFIEAPYRHVVEKKVTDDVKYLSALEEEQYYIAQANAPVDKDGKLLGDLIPAQKGGSVYLVSPDQVEFMDVLRPVVSASRHWIPFLEHDSQQAHMGSNISVS